MFTASCGTAALSPPPCSSTPADWPGAVKATLRVIVVIVAVLLMARMLAHGYTIADAMLVMSTAAGLAPVVVGGVTGTGRAASGWPVIRIGRRALS